MTRRSYSGTSERAKSRELWPTHSGFFLSEWLVPSPLHHYRVHLTSLMWWMNLGLPCLSRSSASVYYTERKPKNENGGGLGKRLTCPHCGQYSTYLVVLYVTTVTYESVCRHATAAKNFYARRSLVTCDSWQTGFWFTMQSLGDLVIADSA